MRFVAPTTVLKNGRMLSTNDAIGPLLQSTQCVILVAACSSKGRKALASASASAQKVHTSIVVHGQPARRSA